MNPQKVVYTVVPQNTDEKPSKFTGRKFGKRHIQVIWLSLIVTTMYTMRTCISVAIVAMTSAGHKNKDVPVYNWPEKSLILSAFLWGYAPPQPFAGWAATKFGGKWFIVGSLLSSSLFTVIVPVCAATTGSIGVMVNRILLGLSQSFLYPTINNLLGRWVPEGERGRLGSVVFAGSALGILLSMVVSGYLCNTWYGWPMAFYVFGVVGVILGCLYCYVGCNAPDEHGGISVEERKYIESNLENTFHLEKLDTPWKAIFKSLPFWALIVAEFGNNFGHWTLLSQIPNYLKNVLKFDMKSYGFLSAVPYILQWLMSFVFGYFADLLITKQIASVTTTRKILIVIAFMGPTIAVLVIAHCDADTRIVALVVLMLGLGCHSAGKSGHLMNYIDLSPNHSGTLMGIGNGASILYASTGNVLIYFTITDDENQDQWRFIFYWTAVTYLIVTAVFTAFGSGKVQSWNYEKKKSR